jgi:peptide deformylase
MYKADGVGLAAPQVGILKRIVTVDVGDGLYEMINPVILEQSGEQDGPEGCLSIPVTSGEVKRPMYVKVKYTDIRGETDIIEAEELFARAVCHEVDHLDGILYKDKAHKMYTPEELE